MSTRRGHLGRAGRALAAVAGVLQAERARWPLWLPVGLGVGAALYLGLNSEPPAWLGPVAAGLTAVALILCRRSAVLSVFLAAALAMVLGFTAAQVRTWSAGTTMLVERTGALMVTGTVSAIQQRSRGWRIQLLAPTFEQASARRRPPPEMRRVRLSVRSDPGPIRVGDVVSVRAILLPVPPPVAPGAFDFQRRAFFDGVGASGFAIGPVLKLDRPSAMWPAWIAVEALRHGADETIRGHLGGDTGGVATALLTGKRDRIEPETLQAIRDSGLAHLLAISGLHVGLVVGAVFFLVRLLLALWPGVAVRRPTKKWAAAVALLAGFAYVLLAGAPIPTQRAFLMVAIVMVAVMVDRIGISMRLVAAAAAVLILVSPEVVAEPGFQMSFAAVVALIAVYEWLRGRRAWLMGDRTWPRLLLLWVGGILLTSIVAGAATAPYAMFHFNRLAVYGVAANLLAVPITAFWVMPMGLMSLVLMPLGLEALPLILMGWGVDAILAVAREVAGWPGAVRLTPAIPLLALVCMTVGGLWLALWRRPWRLAGLAPLALGFALTASGRPPDILISHDGRLMAVRDASGQLQVSSSRRGRYTAAMWTRRSGTQAHGVWPVSQRERSSSEPGSTGLACDGQGCTWQRGRWVIAFSGNRAAAAEDCGQADIVIATVPVRGRCDGATVIDLGNIRRGGSHAIWLSRQRDGKGTPIARIDTDAGIRGTRPWVALPPARVLSARPLRAARSYRRRRR